LLLCPCAGDPGRVHMVQPPHGRQQCSLMEAGEATVGDGAY